MNFSAAKLIKCSAKQLVYFDHKKNKYKGKSKVSDRVLKGQEDAEEKAEHLQEMRGTLKFNDNLMFFSWDEVFDSDTTVICMERKMVDERVEEWYFQSSIIQTAFYAALTYKVDDLYTAKFARKSLKTQHVDLRNKELQFVLCFGDDVYDVRIDNYTPFVRHLKHKANIVQELDYEKATEWDRLYKHREYPLFKDNIEYEPR